MQASAANQVAALALPDDDKRAVAALAVESAGVSPEEDDNSKLPGELLEPNAGGVIIFSDHSGTDTMKQSIANPFAIRVLPKAVTVDTVLKVGGIIYGERRTVIINGKVCEVGKSVEGFNVHRINREYVIVERDSRFAKIPRNIAVIIRLPKT